MRISADRDVCIGAGNCVLTAPELFDQGEDDGVVVLLRANPDQEQSVAAREAAALCPSGAITLTEEE